MGKSFGTLEKAIQILCLFSSENPELTAQEMAGKLGMPLSTTYKYLQVFCNKGFLSKNERTNKFLPGLTILKLGLLAAEKTSIIDIATPYLKSLADRSMETALLTMLNGLNVVCVDIVESSRAVKFITGKGSTMPLYAGSPGKAVLAFKDPSFIDLLIESTGLVKLNKNTITDIKQLKKELTLIRKQRFSESDSELESDVCSVAAPIFDPKGRVIASICVAGPSERIFRENNQSLIDLVKKCAQGISSELGYEERKVGLF
jgi:IclR family transcriptional regulator, KDG regulon repressor